MERKTIFKIRKIGTYILPFISMAIVSFIIDIFVNILSSDLFKSDLQHILFALIWPITFLVVGYYIEPENKIKAIKTLSIISCIMNLVVFYGSPTEYIEPTVSIIFTIITFLSINRLTNKKSRINEIQSK